MAKPTIFELDFLDIFNGMVDDFRTTTGYALERHDAERIVLQVFANSVYQWGSKWKEASLQSYLEYMTGAQLDAYGETNLEPRLASTPSGSWVRVLFRENLDVYYPIHANTVVTGSNENGTFTFKALEEKIGVPGDEYVDVWVEEFLTQDTNSGELANDISIGDLNTLSDLASYPLVDSVANIGESYGGHAGEQDDHYKKRLYYVLGAPATAGSFDGYMFHSLSAHSGVLDIGILKPGWEIDIYVLPFNFTSSVIGDLSSQLSNLVLEDITTVDTDLGYLYWSLTGSPARTLTLYKDSAKAVPVAEYVGVNAVGCVLASKPGYTVNGTVDLSGSTDDTDIANVVETYAVAMMAVNEKMNPSAGESKIRPMNDIVNLYMSVEKTFLITKLDVQIMSGNVDTVYNRVRRVVDAFRDSLLSGAGKSAVKGDLDAAIRSLGGIHDTDIEFDSAPTLKLIEAGQNEYLTCNSPTINVTVHTP